VAGYKELAARCTELASESSEPAVAEALRALGSDYLAPRGTNLPSGRAPSARTAAGGVPRLGAYSISLGAIGPQTGQRRRDRNHFCWRKCPATE
jgi:hypothetical protein